VKDPILQAFARLIKKAKLQLVIVGFNWMQMVCVNMPSIRAARE